MSDVEQGDQPVPEIEEMTPIAVTGVVTIGGVVQTSDEPADFGTYSSFAFAATDPKRQILPYDKQRVRAWILVSGTGPVYIGSEAQCAQVSAGNLAGGGALAPANVPIMIGSKSVLWAVPDGTHTATVSVIQERMDCDH